MRLIASLLLVWSFLPLLQVSAQVGGSIADITGDSVSITLDPQFPNPGDRVTAAIDDYSIGGTGATITWFFDGLSVPTVANNRTITFTAPEIGTSQKIVARLTFTNGRTLEATRTLNPLYLDLIIEPQTYTPVFYQGRALPTKGSLVYINALLLDKNGPIDSSQYNYSWTLNNKSVYGGARLGGNWAQIEVPHGRSSTVTISVQDKKGVMVARKLVSIPSVSLETHFYQINSLLGLSQRAITDGLILSGPSATVRAVPYYLDTRAINGNLFTEWSIDTIPILLENSDPFEINLAAGVTGSAVVRFKIRNLVELLQSDEVSFQVKL